MLCPARFSLGHLLLGTRLFSLQILYVFHLYLSHFCFPVPLSNLRLGFWRGEIFFSFVIHWGSFWRYFRYRFKLRFCGSLLHVLASSDKVNQIVACHLLDLCASASLHEWALLGNDFFYLFVGQIFYLTFIEDFQALDFQLKSGVGFLRTAFDYLGFGSFPLIFRIFQLLRSPLGVPPYNFDLCIVSQPVHMCPYLPPIPRGDPFAQDIIVNPILLDDFLQLLHLIIMPRTKILTLARHTHL